MDNLPAHKRKLPALMIKAERVSFYPYTPDFNLQLSYGAPNLLLLMSKLQQK